jgi:hypothetical protein
LFALAHLDPDGRGPDFDLYGRKVTPRELFAAGLSHHRHGTHLVCQNYHMTEGLCASSARMSGLHLYFEDAQECLSRQLETLIELDLVLDQVMRPSEINKAFEAMRTKFLFHAGHAIELASFAMVDGFYIDGVYIRCINRVFNRLNEIIMQTALAEKFEENLFHLSHYRRALTLFQALRGPTSRQCSASTLRLFTLENTDLT